MTTAADFLREAERLGCEVLHTDNKVGLRGPADAVARLRPNLARLKPELLEILRRKPCLECERRENAPQGSGTAEWCQVYREAWKSLAASYQRAGAPRRQAERRAFEQLAPDACGDAAKATMDA